MFPYWDGEFEWCGAGKFIFGVSVDGGYDNLGGGYDSGVSACDFMKGRDSAAIGEEANIYFE
jgi:hypothetical protein